MSDFESNQTAAILCVDDDPVMLDIYKKYLDGSGYTFFSAASAADGLELAKEIRPDIIVSDVVMPQMDGIEFCRAVKRSSELRTTIFILVSAVKDQPADAVSGLEGGADEYLFKPLQKKEFFAKIRAFLRIKFLQDKLLASNRKLDKALRHVKGYKKILEEKNQALSAEKEMLQNSLKQISLLMKDREKANAELARLNATQEEFFNGIIDILSGVIESKRQYHRGHSRKVSEIAAFMAQEWPLPPEQVRRIEIAALLHELGKLSIPDDLAMKNPANYSEREKDLLSGHPVDGAALLEKFKGFKGISRIVRHFHERVDGTGSPDRLRREEIPVGSRILAAANIYDNLVFRKKNGSTELAFETIEGLVGSHLDAKAVFCLHQYAAVHPVREDDRTTIVSLYELEPGMTLAAGIFTAGGAMLLPRNTLLTDESIHQIVQYSKQDPIEEKIFIK